MGQTRASILWRCCRTSPVAYMAKIQLLMVARGPARVASRGRQPAKAGRAQIAAVERPVVGRGASNAASSATYRGTARLVVLGRSVASKARVRVRVRRTRRARAKVVKTAAIGTLDVAALVEVEFLARASTAGLLRCLSTSMELESWPSVAAPAWTCIFH